MEPPGGRDSRFNLGYSMNLLSGETPPEIYGNPNLGRPSTSLQQLSPRHTMVSSACGNQIKGRDVCYDDRGMPPQGIGLEACGVNEVSDDTYGSLQAKKSPPSNGKKTKGRVKIKMEYIENKLRRYTTFSKRKTGIMKKAYELSTLTGTQVMLLVASETGHVYTFATRKLQPMITSEAGKALIQTCLNSPDPPAGSASGDQRMSATGFEETELTYNISDEDSKGENNVSPYESSESSDEEIPDLGPDTVIIPPTDPPLFSSKSPTPPRPSQKLEQRQPTSSHTTSSPSATTQTTTKTTSSSHTSTTAQPPPIFTAPLVYQTAQANGLSFDIEFEEEDGESIIRKHPPKRFQKLEDQQLSPPVSLVRLQEKLDEAEIRRQQILQQRIQSAKYRKSLKKQSSVYSIDEDDGMDHLKVPEDLPSTPVFLSSHDIISNGT